MVERLKRARAKGIFLIPSLITSAAFFAGFYSIVKSIQGEYYLSAWAIVIGAVLDGLDGRVARLIGSSSQFGVEFDSLSDLTTFGVAPAVLVYNIALEPFGRIGWMAAFLFALCGALRLARFNVQTEKSTANTKFVGLPVPGAAGFLASMILLLTGEFGARSIESPVVVALLYALALLMVSGINYRSFKNFSIARAQPFHRALGALLIAFLVALYPEIFLFALGVIYILSGPVEWAIVHRGARWGEQWRSIVGISPSVADRARDRDEQESPGAQEDV